MSTTPLIEFCVRSGGSNVNAGTLNGSSEPATTPLVTYTNGAWNSSTKVFTPASGNPVTAGVAVGHFVSIYTDGASATGYCAQVSAVSSTTITLNVTLSVALGTVPTTAASGMSATVGGAWAGPSGSTTFPFNLTSTPVYWPRINVKNDQTYSMTSGITANLTGFYQGYSTTFGDGGRATIDGGTSGASYVLWTGGTSTNISSDFVFQHNGATGTATLVSSSGTFFRCVFRTCRAIGFTGGKAVSCEAYGTNQANSAQLAAFYQCNAFYCLSHHNNAGQSCNGFWPSSTNVTAFCIAAQNAGAGYAGHPGSVFLNCLAYNNGRDGFGNFSGNSTTGVFINCVSEQNADYGFEWVSVTTLALNNATVNNVSAGTSGTMVLNIGELVVASAIANSPTTGDFSPAAGSPVKGAAFSPFPLSLDTSHYSATTPSYQNIGAAQSKPGAVIITED